MKVTFEGAQGMCTHDNSGVPASEERSEGFATPARDLKADAFIRHKVFNERKSAVGKYAALVVGEFSFVRLLKYELTTSLFGPLPGALGLLLRKIFYPLLFKEIGRGVVFGRNVVLRHCHRIKIGDRVIIDDYTLLDARGAGEQGIVIEDDVIINRGCIIQAKVGNIHICRRSDVGAGTAIVSQGGVHIGERVSIGGGCKISGGLFEMLGDEDADPPYRRYSKGPVHIEKRCLLAMGAVVLDDVTVGEGSMVGAGTVVSVSLPPYSISSPRPALMMNNPHVNQHKSEDTFEVSLDPQDRQLERSMDVVQRANRAVFSAIDELNQQLPPGQRLEKSLHTVLFDGQDNTSGGLDSLGLVNLIVATEQIVEKEYGIEISLADEKAIRQGASPFRTIGTFVDYVSSSLENNSGG